MKDWLLSLNGAISWLLYYCPAECRAGAGILNLANSLNLLLALLASVALGVQFRQEPSPAAGTAR